MCDHQYCEFEVPRMFLVSMVSRCRGWFPYFGNDLHTICIYFNYIRGLFKKYREFWISAGYVYSIFVFFCGVMSVLISLTYADMVSHFECSVNFWQLFCLDVVWLVFDFCLFQKMDERICIKFCVKNKIKCADAFRMLTVAYGKAALDSLACHSGSPRPKKARQVWSNMKVLLRVFFDGRGVLHHEFLL